MKRLIVNALATLIICFNGPALAEDDWSSFQYDCDKIIAAPQEAACNIKIKDTYSGVDVSYKKTLAAISKYFSDEEMAEKVTVALKDNQNAWVHYRNSQCAYESAGHTGTGGASARIYCLSLLNKDRIHYLGEQTENFK